MNQIFVLVKLLSAFFRPEMGYMSNDWMKIKANVWCMNTYTDNRKNILFVVFLLCKLLNGLQ